MVPFGPSKNKVFRPRHKAPARGACREGHPKEARPRQEELAGRAARSTRPRQEELAGKANQGTCRGTPRVPARPGERQAPGPDKTRRETSSRTRQDINRGKALAATSYYSAACAPAHPPTCRSGTIPSIRGEKLCSQGHVVAKRR